MNHIMWRQTSLSTLRCADEYSIKDFICSQCAFTGNYREGMATDKSDKTGMYFGTNTGKIFASRDEGDSWSLLADNLPPVYSISTGAV